jgi:hypothetical protein
VLRIRDVYTGSRIQIFPPGSRIKKSPDRIRNGIKDFKYFNPKIVSKLSRKCGEKIRIRDVHPGSGFFPIPLQVPDPEVKKTQKASDPGSATLVKR